MLLYQLQMERKPHREYLYRRAREAMRERTFDTVVDVACGDIPASGEVAGWVSRCAGGFTGVAVVDVVDVVPGAVPDGAVPCCDISPADRPGSTSIDCRESSQPASNIAANNTIVSRFILLTPSK